MINPQFICPQWVLLEGNPHHVSEFAGLDPKRRPSALCPLCQQKVILKLGNERAHHYAHLPEIICPSTQPETALHLNVKYYLYFQLQQSHSILIENSCAGHCNKKRQHIWLQEWDEVIVEHNLGSYRPDITFLLQGKVVGALEILVSHQVGEQKASYFQEYNIPWLEIRATESFYAGNFKWMPDNPLPFYRQAPASERWTCSDCMEKEKKQKEQLQYQENNFERIREAKLSDIYFKSGKKFREMFFLMEQFVNGQCVKIWVKTEKNEIIAVQHSPITDKTLEKLHQAVDHRLDEDRKKGAIVDNCVEWQPWVAGKRFVARDTDHHPFNYHWDEKKNCWAESFPDTTETISTMPPAWRKSTRYNDHTPNFSQRKVETSYPYQPKVGTCKYCGISTDDWVSFDGKTHECICRNCKDKY